MLGILAVNHFRKKTLLWMFDKVLNIPNFQKFENAKQSNKKVVLIYPNN